MNERKLYEWVKATPENLPKGDLWDSIPIRTNDGYGVWFLKDIIPEREVEYLSEVGEATEYLNRPRLRIPNITYLKEINSLKAIIESLKKVESVDLKWPSESEINKKIAEVPFMPYLEHHLSLSSRLNAYEKGFTAAIQWLQQQLKK